jgi:hypothetical protein
VQRRSLLGGYPRHDALPPFLLNFSKNPDKCVETDRTSERFFGRKLDLAKSKGGGLRGERGCCSFKAPSAHASTAMARRLANTLRVPRSSSDLFSRNIRVAFWTPVRKMISLAKSSHVTSRVFRVLGGCERVAVLSELGRPSFPTPTPPWLQSKARSPQFSKIDCPLLQSSSGAWKQSGSNIIRIKYLATRLVALRLVRVITQRKLWYN